MTNEELNTQIYNKMSDELKSYTEWLMNLPKEDILNHTYEYTVKQDIVFAMEYEELTDEECKALLKSPSPLNDIYEHYNKLETGYMEDIRYCIDRVSHMIITKDKEMSEER